MTLFNDKPTQLATIVGKYVCSGGCTDVIGGTMTAGTADAGGSALITWAPAFISAPVIIAQGFSAAGTTSTLMGCLVTGVTVSNAYIECYASGGSVNVIAIGQARL
jgi:hypothetical protein